MNKTTIILFALMMSTLLYNPIEELIPQDPIEDRTEIPIEIKPEPPYIIGEEAQL